MAFPIIQISNASGSGGTDSGASGAGPGDGTTSGTALTGNAATTDSTGLIVSLSGSPSLANLLRNGSHVIYINDTVTANGRNFGRIIDFDDTLKTVTVDLPFGINLPAKSWAIGGKRLTIASSSSIKLINNGSTALADAMPGWTIEFGSGHSEVGLATAFTFRRSGDVTGRITFRGVSGAATRPYFRHTLNASCWNINGNFVTLRDFDIANSSGGSSSVGLTVSGLDCSVRGVRSDDASNKYAKPVQMTGGTSVIEGSKLQGTVANLEISGATVRVLGNVLSNGLGAGLLLSGTLAGVSLQNCIITGNTGNGVSDTRTSVAATGGLVLEQCTIANNGGDGINFANTTLQVGSFRSGRIQNCQITNNQGYGINYAGSGMTQTILDAYGFLVRYNNFGLGAGVVNLSGDTNSGFTVGTLTNVHVNPLYTNAAGLDFSVTASGVKGVGYPGLIAFSGTTSVMDIGAAQAAPASAVYTSAANVRNGTDRGDGVTGTLVVPSTATVLVGTTFDNGSTGAVTLPVVGYVRATVTFGPSLSLTGTDALPAVGRVQTGFGFGAGGTEFTGTLVTTGVTIGDLQAELDTRNLTATLTAYLNAGVKLQVGAGAGQIALTGGKVSALVDSNDVTGTLNANVLTVKGLDAGLATVIDANVSKVNNQTANATGPVTFPGTIASTTNITAATGIVLSPVTHTGAIIPRVSLCDVTTINTDMRGTNSAMLAGSYLAPDNASIGIILTKATAIDAKTTNLPASPAAVGSPMTLTGAYDPAKTAAQASTALSTAVWTNTKAGYIDASIAGVGTGGTPQTGDAYALIGPLISGGAFTGAAMARTLDSIPTTEPTILADGPMSTWSFRKLFRWGIMRFAVADKTPDALVVKTLGGGVSTTQSVGDDQDGTEFTGLPG